MNDLWSNCLVQLENQIPNQQFNTWIRPLQALETQTELKLLAPNKFVLDWVEEHFARTIEDLLINSHSDFNLKLVFEIGSKQTLPNPSNTVHNTLKRTVSSRPKNKKINNLNPAFTFENFVEGKSNQIAKAASLQVVESVGQVYNPLLIYGDVGLGKTHLMHAIGNAILQKNPASSILYLHSEKFMNDMIKGIQHNTMDAFKTHYRSLDALLIDDIQFFAGKTSTQEEFFHTFNTLIENKSQVIMTCDRYPKEVDGLEERLKSRFGWGLPVAIEPPDLETRVAIIANKAQKVGIQIPHEVAFFMAKCIRSNVRELEGALKRIIANAEFIGITDITLDFTKEALRDLISSHEHMVNVENIQKTVAAYFRIRVSDLLSSKRTRSIARPRQIAMALAKELTNKSLPEIGRAFGGKDHTTVLHACRKIKTLLDEDKKVAEDYSNLMRTLAH